MMRWVSHIQRGDETSRLKAIDHADLKYARRPDGTLEVALGGDWKLARGLPGPEGIIEEIEKSPLRKTNRRLRGDVRDKHGVGGVDRRANVELNEAVARRLLLGTKPRRCCARRGREHCV